MKRSVQGYQKNLISIIGPKIIACIIKNSLAKVLIGFIYNTEDELSALDEHDIPKPLALILQLMYICLSTFGP